MGLIQTRSVKRPPHPRDRAQARQLPAILKMAGNCLVIDGLDDLI
jgi:hypothetical protein